LVGFAAGNLGEQMARDTSRPSVALALTAAESDKLLAARSSLSKTFAMVFCRYENRRQRSRRADTAARLSSQKSG
jgi:uncharacterized membrane protein (UPF0127 family)